MCPDKPPSCYPTPTLGESRPERFDRHALKQSASGVQIVADREHVFSATGRQELRGPHVVAKGTRPGSSRAIDYTVEGANRLAEELRAIPPKDPAKRKLDKQGMVSLLAGELLALQQRGYTIEEVAESLRGRGLDHHDADPQELPPARQEQDGEASEERGPDRVRRARQRGAKGGEARGAERARARPNSDATSRKAGGEHAGGGRGAGGHGAPERQGSVSREGQGQLLNERMNHVESDLSRRWGQGRRGQVTDVDGPARLSAGGRTGAVSRRDRYVGPGRVQDLSGGDRPESW